MRASIKTKPDGSMSLSISTSKRRERYLRVSSSQLDSMSGSLPWSRSRERVCNSTVENQRGGFSHANDVCGTRTEVEGARRVRAAASPGPSDWGQHHGSHQRRICLRAMSSEAFSPTLPPTATATRPSRCSKRCSAACPTSACAFSFAMRSPSISAISSTVTSTNSAPGSRR